jgi:hypothetical protein
MAQGLRSDLPHIMGGASHHDRRRGYYRGTDACRAWAFLGPSGGDDAGARITADPATTPVAISLAPTAPMVRHQAGACAVTWLTVSNFSDLIGSLDGPHSELA